ncbi:MAG: PaaI family thioesterase [Eubacteriales bacterium]|nr:PaaI family thioesterase [Eubacteriales bacterium]
MHEYAEKIASIGAEANPTFMSLGITPVSWGGGKAVLKMTAKKEFHNGIGFLQGGFYVILADEAIALAVLAELDPGSGTTTISETTEFIRGTKDDEIFAEAKIIRKGRRIIFAEAEVRRGSAEGDLLSKTTASYLITQC